MNNTVLHASSQLNISVDLQQLSNFLLLIVPLLLLYAQHPVPPSVILLLVTALLLHVNTQALS